jgi:aminopeptidase N
MTHEICRLQASAGDETTFASKDLPEKSARDRDFHAKHLKLELSFDLAEKRVQGTATWKLIPINDGLSQIILDAIDLEIERIVDQSGEALDFGLHDKKLQIKLAHAHRSGEELQVAISYQAQPAKGLFFIAPDEGYPDKPYQVWSQGQAEDNRFWFPCYDATNEKFTSEVLLTVEERFATLSNGQLAETTHASKRKMKTYHWVQDKPHVNYLVTIVVGEFDEASAKVDGIPIQYYVPKGDGHYIPMAFDETPKMVEFFSEVTGCKYPWAKYAQVVVRDFTFGGMENTSLTVLFDTALHNERAHPDYRAEPLIAHELAHQWFGDLLTMKSWPHSWLNEGFASYFDPLYFEHRWGKDEFHLRMRDEAQAYFDEDEKNYRRPIVAVRYQRADDLFDRHTYQKGSWVLHMMRGVLGDELFFKAIRHYVQKHAYQTVETNDLKEAIEEATGRNLDWFFNQWAYKAGHPEYEVQTNWDESSKLLTVTVKQTQKVTELTPLFRMPITLEITMENGKRQRERVEVNEVEQSFHFRLTERPKVVLFDPEGWVLKKVKFEKSRDERLYQLEHAEQALARTETCEGLSKFLGDARVVKGLQKALDSDSFYGVRSAAAKALGDIATREAQEVLLAALVSEKDSRVRSAICRALGECRDEGLFERLAQVFDKDEKYYVAAAAAEALGKTGAKAAFARLVSGLERGSHTEVIRRSIFAGLAELKDARAIDILFDYTRWGMPTYARLGAISALGKLGDSLKEQREKIRLHSEKLLRDPEPRVRRATADALGTLGDPAAIPELESIKSTDLFGYTRRVAEFAIKRIREKQGEWGEKGAVQKELQALKDENRELKAKFGKIESQLEALAKANSKNSKGRHRRAVRSK